MQHLRGAPARLSRCAGVFVFILAVACEKSPFKRETKLDVGGDTISLTSDVDLHEVGVKLETGKEFEPAIVVAAPGDVVRFKTGDAMTHVISFDDARLPASTRQALAQKTQLRSPPLLTTGVTWIVALEGLPAGTYPFRCDTHGHSGQIQVK